MELHQLRYFVEVARTESISKAAAILHITQPALSKSIARLEEELGIQLFERRGKRLHLNELGRNYYATAKRILAELDESANALRRLDSGEEGSVRIAVYGPQRSALSCTTAFMEKNPRVRVSFEARQTTANRQTVHEFDIVFYPADDAFERVVGVPYERSVVRLAVPLGHDLANKKQVSLSELCDESFVFMNTTGGMYERSYKLCTDNGFYPHVRAVTTSGAAQVEFIRKGLGIGFVDTLMGENPIAGLALLDVDTGIPDQVLCFACRPVGQLSGLAMRYLQHAFDFFGIPASAETFDQFNGN